MTVTPPELPAYPADRGPTVARRLVRGAADLVAAVEDLKTTADATEEEFVAALDASSAAADRRERIRALSTRAVRRA